MPKFTTLVILLFFLAPSFADGGQAQVLEHIFVAASRKDLRGIYKLQKIAKDNVVKRAIPVALYIADPAKFEKQFVESFPTDYNGLMIELYEVELSRKTPNFLYAIEHLNKIAFKGDRQAIRKLLEANSHSDGVVGALLCEGFLAVHERHKKLVASELQLLNKRDKEKNFRCMEL